MDKKTIEIAQGVTTVAGERRFSSNIMHFLVDYNVISNSIALMTALEIRLFVSETVERISIKYLNLENNPILRRLVSVIIILILCYLFIQLIYYPYMYTAKIAKENIIKKAIVDKNIEDVKKKIRVSSMPDTFQVIST
jgi:uncharacterized protein YacL